MSGEYDYWLALLEELDRAAQGVAQFQEPAFEGPEWVFQVQLRSVNLVLPKVQLRNGAKPTPQKIGAIVGSHLSLIKDLTELSAALMPPEGPERKFAQEMFRNIGVFDLEELGEYTAATREIAPRVTAVLPRVLEERPREEAAAFFKGFARGLGQTSLFKFAENKNGSPQASPRQLAKIRTGLIYRAVMTHWRKIDRMETSTAAHDFLAAFIPQEILGCDPERTRRMFGRVGKKFKGDGRPRKK